MVFGYMRLLALESMMNDVRRYGLNGDPVSLARRKFFCLLAYLDWPHGQFPVLMHMHTYACIYSTSTNSTTVGYCIYEIK